MKRVLQVVGKMNIGGAEQLLMNVYRHIDRDKIQFDFLTFYEEGERGFFDEEICNLGGKIVNISKPSVLHPMKNISEVKKVLKETPYDVIHTHIGSSCAYALEAAKRCNVPIRIMHAHNTPHTESSVFKKWYNCILGFWCNRSMTACCACSKEAATYRFEKQKIKEMYTYIPNAVDFEAYYRQYDSEILRKDLGIDMDELLVLQTGNLKTQKNQLFTIELARELVQENIRCRFVFAGRTDGEYGQTVVKKIEQYNLKDQFILLGQRTDIPQLMAVADVMIMPSLWEGLGIVLIEAQASGLACIVSEAIQPEADVGLGLVQKYSLSDMQKWVAALRAVARKEPIPCEIRKKQLEQSGFSLSNTVKCFEKLYNI